MTVPVAVAPLRQPLRLGFVGVNARAQRLLVPGLAASPHAELVAICSRDLVKATKAADAVRDHASPLPFSSLSIMLAEAELDAVFINTPASTHLPLCLAAIDAGCHVICEKPLGTDSAQAASLVEAAAVAGVRTAVNFTYRSVPGYRVAERWLRSHELGAPLHAAFALLQSHNFLPDFRHGSALRDSGAHLFDAMAGLLDVAGFGHIGAVCAARMDEPDGVDHGWSFSARTARGGVASAVFSRSSLGWRNGFRWALYGDQASLDVELDADRTLARCALRGDDQPMTAWNTLPIPDDIATDDARFPAFHMDRLVRAVGDLGDVRGDHTFPGFSHALRAHLLADALAASVDRGTWTEVAQP